MKEQVIENMLIDQLVGLGYQKVTFSESFTMEDNIRECLSKINNKKYSDSDIDKILKHIKHKTDESAHYAYTFNEIMEKGIRLQLNNEKLSQDNKPYIYVFDKSCAQNNTFQVSHQIVDKENQWSRYDVTILINGFPIVQIELKRPDVEIDEAVNQINRYIMTAFTGIFRYTQLFIVSNDTETKYGINTNDKINKLFMFNWSDSSNSALHHLTEFTNSFLDRNTLFDMLTKFIVRYKTGNGKMIVLRPYQIYAIKEVIKKVTLPSNVNTNNLHNGYVFHTTGSGKTLTSWKCVQLASEIQDVDKVVFLVDRKDLDSQTTQEFKSIDSNLDIDETQNTSKLLKNFRDSKAVITTIQKLSIAIKKVEDGDLEYSTVFGKYRNKRVVFIIDECHRTQYGEMHTRIDKFFTNDVYIGFTGTPLFDENKGASGLTTSQLFGKELHTYRIKDAIRDKNVLGFSIDYYNTAKGNEILDSESNAVFDDASIDTDEVLLNPKRIENIVKQIFSIHDKKTLNRKYTALFAVQSIKQLLMYYDEFKRQNSLIDDDSKKLRISAIFTASDNEQEKLEDSNEKRFYEIMQDFSKMSGVNCQSDDTFRAELVKSLRAERDPHIDIVIVVGIFLTGFDSKFTNTLYVDKKLEWHNLLQAFSRTNRVESINKPFGNIVCFRNLKLAVDESVALFNYGKDSDGVIAKSYDTVIKELIKAIDELNAVTPKSLVLTDQSEEVQKNFIEKMRKVNNALNEAKQFTKFDWAEIEDKLPEDKYQALIGQLKEIKDKTEHDDNKESVLKYIDFCMELVEEDKIDLDYIRRLITNVDLSSHEALKDSVRSIKEAMDKSTSDSVRLKKELIKKFLDKLILDSNEMTPEQIKELDIVSYFRIWLVEAKEEEIEEQAQKTNVDTDKITKELIKYDITNKVDEANINNIVRSANPKESLGVRGKLKKALNDFVKTFNDKFKDLYI